MLRREFLSRTATGLAATWLANKTARAAWLDAAPLERKHLAQDEVVLGATGIRTSRLAMGTGTIGYAGGSNQTRTGRATNLLRNGFHDNGLRFFDAADSYGSHPYVKEAIKGCLATRSPCSRKPTPATPPASKPTSIASAASLASITLTSC